MKKVAVILTSLSLNLVSLNLLNVTAYAQDTGDDNIAASIAPSPNPSTNPSLDLATIDAAEPSLNSKKNTLRRLVKAPPSFKNIYHVKAENTPSGFQVPRFVSLKFGKVNGRTGPSRDHPIAWQYRRRGLPLLVVAETHMWRKVRDITGDESWVRKPALSGEKYVLTLETTPLHAKPETSARISAQSQANAVLKLESCTDTQWCKVSAENGLKGWAPRHKFWGAETLN